MYTLICAIVALLTASVGGSPLGASPAPLPNLVPTMGVADHVFAPLPGPLITPKGFDMSGTSLKPNTTTLPPYQGSIPVTNSSLHDKRINTPDPRYQYTDPNHFPWRTIGRVNWVNSRTYCTGALVGPRHILTSRHCVPPNGGGFVFCPSYSDGPNPTFGCSQVTYYYFYTDDRTSDCSNKEDWIVAIIDKRFGDGLGYFGVGTPQWGEFGSNHQEWENVGYPGDRNGEEPWRQDNAYLPLQSGSFSQFSCDGYGPIYSSDNSAPGSSGSPLWYQGGTIWGVLSGGGTASNGLFESLFASGDHLVNQVGGARSSYS